MTGYKVRLASVFAASMISACGLATPGLAQTAPVYGKQNSDVDRIIAQADTLYRQGHFDEAELLCRGALAIDEKALRPRDPATARDLDALAVDIRDQRRYAEAESLNSRAVVIDEKALGPEHPMTRWYAQNLGRVLEAQGKHADAVEAFRSACKGSENDSA